MWSYDDKIPDYPYDPEKAKAMLEAAGVKTPLEIDLWYSRCSAPTIPNGKRIGEMMQADLAKVGVNAKLVTYEWGEYRKRAQAGEDMTAQLGWTGDNGDPDNFFFLDGCADGKPANNNIPKWCNAEFNDLLVKARVISDQGERAILSQQHPVANLDHRGDGVAILVERTSADGDNLAFVALLDRGVRQHDAADLVHLRLEAADQHTVEQRKDAGSERLFETPNPNNQQQPTPRRQRQSLPTCDKVTKNTHTTKTHTYHVDDAADDSFRSMGGGGSAWSRCFLANAPRFCNVDFFQFILFSLSLSLLSFHVLVSLSHRRRSFFLSFFLLGTAEFAESSSAVPVSFVSSPLDLLFFSSIAPQPIASCHVRL